MKTRILLIICFAQFFWGVSIAQHNANLFPVRTIFDVNTDWMPKFMNTRYNDTLIHAYKGSPFYKGVPNQMLIITKPKKPVHIEFKYGTVKQVKDSLYEVIPDEEGNYEIKINGWRSSGRIERLPEPGFLYLKGIQFPVNNDFCDPLRGVTLNDIIQSNKIEARFKDYIYKVKEFRCRIIGINGPDGESEMFSPVFKTDSIDIVLLKSLNIINQGTSEIWLVNVVFVAPDSSVIETTRNYFLAKVFKDSAHMLIDRYTGYNGDPYKTVKANIRVGIEGNATKEDIRTIKNIINELNSNLISAKAKLVKHFPSVVIRFDTIGDQLNTSWKSIAAHPFFPLLSNKQIHINSKKVGQNQRDLILWREISKFLSDFEDFSYCDYHSAIIGKTQNEGLTQEDKATLKILFSRGSDKIIKDVFTRAPNMPKSSIFLVILVSLLLFFVILEINNYYGITDHIKSLPVKWITSSVVIAQIFIGTTYVFKDLDWVPRVPIAVYPFWQNELFYCSFAVIAGLLLLCADLFKSRFKTKWIRLGLDPVLTIIALYLAYQVIYLFVRGEILKFITIDINAKTIALSIVAVRFYLQYENAKISSLMQEHEYELTKQKEIKNRAELNALQARINPHFLYNALNSIAALAHIDPKRTEGMALSLSSLFRYNVNRENEMITTLGKEIEMVHLYLDIEKQRFGTRLTFNIEADEKLYDYHVPRFLIQPLVENAIKHGISKITGQGIIKLKIYELQSNLYMELYDNGPDFEDGLISGYGLQNTYDKLSLVFKKPYEIRFINQPEKFIQIKLINSLA